MPNFFKIEILGVRGNIYKLIIFFNYFGRYGKKFYVYACDTEYYKYKFDFSTCTQKEFEDSINLFLFKNTLESEDFYA